MTAERRFLLIYEIVLFAIALPFFIFQLLSGRGEPFQLLSTIGFPVLLVMYVLWAVLLNLSRYKNLTNFEIIIFILLLGPISKIIVAVLELFGVAGYTIFGLSLGETLILLAIIFVFLGLMLFFYSVLKGQKKEKSRFLKTDFLFLIVGFIIVAAIILIYAIN